MVDLDKLESIQEKIAEQVDVSLKIDVSKIKFVAGFDVAFFQDKAVCGVVVFDANGQLVEKKYSVSKIPMPYIPGFLAFREGPLIIQTYYDLENEPDVLFIDGHGIAHQRKCGLATYVGVELNKPTIGVGKSLLVGDVRDEKIVIDNEERGIAVQTMIHARPLFVSAGHLIDNESAAELVRKFTHHPHKLPEPLHVAHRFAKKTAIKLNGGLPVQDDECIDEESAQERLERECGVNSGSIV